MEQQEVKHLPLLGNENITALKTLSHAYLLAGACGSGRGAVARHLAQVALCTAPEKPCGICTACVKVQRNVHPDVLHFSREKVMSVAEVRQMREDVFIRPNEGKRKIYVIHQGEQLNIQGQNALLKILEEPPSYALFLILTDQGAPVLETIRSRCQVLRLNPQPYASCLAYLQARFPALPQTQVAQEAQRCEGYVGRAVKALRPPETAENSAQSLQNQEETGLKQVKTKRKSKKEEAPVPDAWSPDALCQQLVQTLNSGDELALLEATRPMTKLKKDQILLLFQDLRASLAQSLSRNPQKHTLAWISVLETLSQAVQSNVQAEQIASWFCASMTEEKRKNQAK